MNKTCPQCKTEFHVKPSHMDKRFYCSRACMVEGYKIRLTGENNPNYRAVPARACQNCGKDYFSYDKRRKYCGVGCRPYSNSAENLARLQIMATMPRKPRKPKILPNNKVCAICAKPYRTKASRTSGSNCCSTACRIAKQRLPPKQCVVCGKDHVLHRHTCSPECVTKWASLKQSGNKSHRWQGGKTSEAMRVRNSQEYAQWRTAVYQRDDYTCQICGKRGEKLHADHIKPFATHPELRFDITNGRTLCAPCHFKTDTWGYGARRLLKEQRV